MSPAEKDLDHPDALTGFIDTSVGPEPEPRCPAREHRDRLDAAVPHGPDEPCTCPGCWACDGHVTGCTCDIDWDTEHDLRLGGAPSHEPGCSCDPDGSLDDDAGPACRYCGEPGRDCPGPCC